MLLLLVVQRRKSPVRLRAIGTRSTLSIRVLPLFARHFRLEGVEKSFFFHIKIGAIQRHRVGSSSRSQSRGARLICQQSHPEDLVVYPSLILYNSRPTTDDQFFADLSTVISLLLGIVSLVLGITPKTFDLRFTSIDPPSSYRQGRCES